MYKKCGELNRDDDYQSRKHGSKWNSHNKTWVTDMRGQLWHPAAYASIPNCTRNTSRVVPYAALIHAKLTAEVWTTASSGTRATANVGSERWP